MFSSLTVCCPSPTEAVKKAHIDCLKSYTDQIKEFSTQEQQDLLFTCFRFTVWNDGRNDNANSVLCFKYLLEEFNLVLSDRYYVFLFGQTAIDQPHKAELAEYVLDRYDFTGYDKAAQGMDVLYYHMYDSESSTARTLKLLPLLHKYGMLHLDAIQRCFRFFSAAELRLIVETLGFDLRSCTYDDDNKEAEEVPSWLTRPYMSSIDDLEWLVAYFNMTDYATFPFKISLKVEAAHNLDMFIEHPCIRNMVMGTAHSTQDCKCMRRLMKDETCPFPACYEVYKEHREAAVKIIAESIDLPLDVIKHEIVQYL